MQVIGYDVAEAELKLAEQALASTGDAERAGALTRLVGRNDSAPVHVLRAQTRTRQHADTPHRHTRTHQHADTPHRHTPRRHTHAQEHSVAQE